MKIILTTIFTALTIALYAGQQPSEKNVVETNFQFAHNQLLFAVDQIDKAVAITPKNLKGQPFICPRTINKDGSLRLVTIKDWTCGFFAGSLWYTYEYTNDSNVLAAARRFTQALTKVQFRTDTHDLGFMMYCSYGNGYRLTGDTTYRNTLIQTARSLISRYNPVVGSLRSWDHNGDKWKFPVIIDNMMNLELLFWATRETGDSTFYNIAVNHANTTMKNHFRSDYSSYHVISYNPETGAIEARNTHQGYADNSAWARGQAWGIYGYTMCYRETGDPKYLAQAENIANFIFTHPNLPSDLIPYWDYNSPKIPNTPRDASAAAVTASALYELSMYNKAHAAQYKAWADTIMCNLTAHYRATPNTAYGFLLLHSTGNKPQNDEVDVPINYADYYFMEALERKHKLETTGKAL